MFCEAGKVTEWTYFAQGAGQVFVAIYHPMNDGRYTLKAKTQLTSSGWGVQTETLSPQDQIDVEVGDIVGIHYADSSSTGVIRYIWGHSDFSRTFAYSGPSELSRVYNAGIHDSTLNVGTIVTLEQTGSFRLLPALKATVTGTYFNISSFSGYHYVFPVHKSTV